MKSERESCDVVVLYNASENLVKGEPQDILAEQGVIACARAVADALRSAGYRVAQVPICDDVESALAPYPPDRWDVFNLGEGLAGRLFEEARIAWALEAMGYCFTGASGGAIVRGVHKARTKQLLAAEGVNTPSGWLFRRPGEVDALAAQLCFPLIVKPVAEDASIGVGPEAVVHTAQALRERVAYVTARYRQAALAELFVTGREFNVALWGGEPPQTLPLAEIDFSAFADPYVRIVSFAAKWQEDSFEYCHTPVICPAPVDAALGDRIEETARRAWAAVGCRGYARVDMRLGDGDLPYVVEVNCNPDLSPDAGFYNAAWAAGYSYADMVTHILEIARRQFYVDDRICNEERRPISIGHNGRSRRVQSRRVGLRRGTLERLAG